MIIASDGCGRRDRTIVPRPPRVHRNQGILKKMAVDEDGGSMRVKYQTLNKLIDYGLIREDEQKYKHNAKPLFCTEMGNIVGENLERIYQALPYKECSPDEYK